MRRCRRRSRRALLPTVLGATVLAWPVAAQFEDAKPPPEMSSLDFMIGEWTVEGTFRNPDHVGADRTLWYETRGGGVTRFDGASWTAFQAGDSPSADSVLAAVTQRAAPYPFTNPLEVRRAQDGFVLVLDEGRTSGTAVVYFDTTTSEWVSWSLHAATNSVTGARAVRTDGLPVFTGSGTDRRGERIFRRGYEVHDADHYTIRTDVSFDGGATWIEDQIVQEVRRR